MKTIEYTGEIHHRNEQKSDTSMHHSAVKPTFHCQFLLLSKTKNLK